MNRLRAANSLIILEALARKRGPTGLFSHHFALRVVGPDDVAHGLRRGSKTLLGVPQIQLGRLAVRNVGEVGGTKERLTGRISENGCVGERVERAALLPPVDRLVNRMIVRILVIQPSIHQFREGFTAKLFRGIAVHTGERGIHLENRLPAVDEDRDSESRLPEDALPFVDLDLLLAPLADIAKYQHYAQHLIPRIANRRSAI